MAYYSVSPGRFKFPSGNNNRTISTPRDYEEQGSGLGSAVLNLL